MASLKSFLPFGKGGKGAGGGGDGKPGVTSLFTKTDPAVDGDDCLHDCASCSVKYPARFKIEESDALYGHVKAWEAHLVVATGKADWVSVYFLLRSDRL
jgi:hypothetical protein